MEFKGSYGIDAPNVVLSAFGLFFGSLFLGFSALFYGPKVWFIYLGCAVLLFLSLFALVIAVNMLYGSLKGKFKICERMLKEVKDKWSGDERVLDIGCGRGLVMLQAAKLIKKANQESGIDNPKSPSVYGVDVWSTSDQSGNGVESLFQNAITEGVESLIQTKTADARKLPFNDKSFDVVVSSLAIHNILEGKTDVASCDERGKAITEAVRVLAPGGRLVIWDILATPLDYQKILLSDPRVCDVSVSEILPCFYQSYIISATRV